MRRHFPYKKVITLALLVAASVFLMNLTGKPLEGPSFWESLLYRLGSPFYKAFSSVRDRYTVWSTAFQDKLALLAQNESLKAELEAIEALKAELAEAKKENERLRDLLNFVETAPGRYEVAKVVSRNPSKWFSTIGISKGALDGVEVDCAVVSRSGLVGRVISVEDHYSTVLLITDPESGVGALVERSRDYGVTLGGSGPTTLVFRLFSKDTDVQTGDKILTSGVGSKYPSGLLIGEVVSVYVPQPGLVKEAVVRPATDLEHLEEVMVLLP